MNKGYTEASKVYTNALDQIFTTDVDVQSTLDKAASEATTLLKEGQ